MTGVSIAIDLDNTLVCYDALFMQAARDHGFELAGGTTKNGIRDAVRGAAGDAAWQVLQAEVYGPRMRDARPFDGAHAFVAHARAQGARLAIVSHKTKVAAAGGVDLHAAASAWLDANDFTGYRGFSPGDVFFEPSRSAKLARIGALRADIVIDDLLEVLTDPAFPAAARRWWFAPGLEPANHGVLECFPNWHAIRAAFDA